MYGWMIQKILCTELGNNLVALFMCLEGGCTSISRLWHHSVGNRLVTSIVFWAEGRSGKMHVESHITGRSSTFFSMYCNHDFCTNMGRDIPTSDQSLASSRAFELLMLITPVWREDRGMVVQFLFWDVFSLLPMWGADTQTGDCLTYSRYPAVKVSSTFSTITVGWKIGVETVIFVNPLIKIQSRPGKFSIPIHHSISNRPV